MKAALILMAVLTVTYVSVVVYANTSANSHRYVVYAAFKYEGDTPPTEWYTPEQLGICGVTEHGGNGFYWLHIAVDPEKEPFLLQEKQPIFLYKDKYYQVSPHWVTPGLPESVKQWQISIGGVLGAGWVLTGVLFLKWRKNG
ncbi:MAG: hypothetical protein K6T73_04845 [Candidatus Bathyarchaeota archaeon]|nr:hypothetical protein [Candidatus Bathyarchaeota archaeon]